MATKPPTCDSAALHSHIGTCRLQPPTYSSRHFQPEHAAELPALSSLSLSAGLFHSLAYSTYVTLPHGHEQRWLGGFDRLGIYFQPMECDRLQGLPSPGKQGMQSHLLTHFPMLPSLLQFLSRYIATATAAVVALTISTQFVLSNIPTLSLYMLLQEMVLSRELHCLVVAVLPLQFNLLQQDQSPHLTLAHCLSYSPSQQPKNCRKSSSGCCTQSMGRRYSQGVCRQLPRSAMGFSHSARELR